MTWSSTSSATKLDITNSGGSNRNISSITVTYASTVTTPQFAESTVTKYLTEVSANDTYTNTLNNTDGYTISSYSYTNTEGNAVTSVGTDGTVTLSGTTGTATIIASYTNNSDNTTGTAEYMLTVSLASPGLTFANDNADVTITLGETYAIDGTYTLNTLTNNGNGSVSYASSSETVATINSDGTVTIVAAGSTIITATSAATSTYEAGEASYTLTINAASTGGDTESGTSTTTGSTSATFGITGATGEISLTSIDTDGTGDTSACTTDSVLTISFANNESGRVVDYYNNSELRCQYGTSFMLSGDVTITQVVINYHSDTTPSSTKRFTTTANFDSTAIDNKNKVQTFISTNGISAKDTLTFENPYSDKNNLYVASIAVTYTPNATLSFAESSVSIPVEGTYTNTLKNPRGITVSYTSEDTSIATVDASTGEVKGVTAGSSTTITATYSGESNEEYDGLSASYTVTVTKKLLGLSFENDSVMAFTTDAVKTVSNTLSGLLDDYTVTYSCTSDDESVTPSDVATVSGSTVTIVGAGTVTISAIFAGNDTYESETASYVLTVIDPSSDTVQDYSNTYTWDFSIDNDDWTSSITQLNNYSQLWDTSTTEGVESWTTDAPSTATGFNVTIIDGLRFSYSSEDSSTGTVTLNYTSGCLTADNGVTVTVPKVPSGYKVMINFSDGTTQITANSATDSADISYSFTGDMSITSITVKDGSLTWNYQTIKETTSRGDRYLAFLLESGTVTPGEENTSVPGITFTMGATETTNTWSAAEVASGAEQTITNGSKSYTCSYAVSSTATATVTDDIPAAGAFFKFTADVNGKLTLYADVYDTSSKSVVESPTGVYAKKEDTATGDYDASSLTELTNGFVVLQDSTYYVYCTGTNEVLRLYGFDFEPSYIYQGNTIPNNYELDELTAGDANYEFPIFAAPTTGVSYKIDPDTDNDGVSVSEYGELKLEKTSGFGNVSYTIKAIFNLSTTTFGTVKDTLSYVIPAILDNDNLYVLDESDDINVGDTIKSVPDITMTYGGWTMNSNKYDNTSGTEIEDGWGAPKTDTTNEYGTFGGLSLSTSGDQNGRSETYGPSDTKYGKGAGAFEPGDRNTLPVRGAYATFEPTKNGTLGIYILQNGCLNIFGDKASKESDDKWKGSSSDFNGRVSWRPFYIADETGALVENVTAKAKSKLRWTAEDLETLLSKQKAAGQTSAVLNYDMSEDDSTYIRSLLTTTNKGTAFINKTNDGGWLALMKTFAYYEMPVKSGKTYYIFSNTSKLGICGFMFKADADQKTVANQLVVSDTTVVSNIEGQYFPNAKINRTFTASTDDAPYWAAICLPFSVSKSQLAVALRDSAELKEGEVRDTVKVNVQLLEYWGVIGSEIELVNHVNNENIIAGVPYLMKVDRKVTNPVITGTVYVPTGITAGTVNNTSDDYDATYTWKGVFTNKTTVDGSEVDWIDGNDWFISGGKFVHTGSSDTRTALGKYRCFLECSSTDMAKSLTGMYYDSVAETDGTADGIVAISLEDVDSSVFSNVSTGVYNLSGQKVANSLDEANSLPAGIYISGGKKMVIR